MNCMVMKNPIVGLESVSAGHASDDESTAFASYPNGVAQSRPWTQIEHVHLGGDSKRNFSYW